MRLRAVKLRGWQLSALAVAAVALGFVQTTNADIIDGGAYYAPGAPVTEEFVIGPTSPGKWGSPVFGTGAVVTYSFMPTGSATEDGSASVYLGDFMPVGWEAAVVAAFDAWSAVADITFVEVPDDGAAFNAPTASGDIRIAGTLLDGAGGTLAHGYFPPTNGLTAAGDIHLDTGDAWKIGFGGPGFDLFQVLAHEIGHAIGLAHTGVPGSLMNPFYTEAFSGPQADDIAGAIFIYGAAPVEPPAVPEPGTLTLVGMGAFGLVMAARRRKSTTAA